MLHGRTSPAADPGACDTPPWRARAGAALVAGGVFCVHLLMVFAGGPVGLSEDEAYYWDWSRRPDICYYSKGPLTALLIRAGCAVFGDTVAGVRMPAVVLRLATAWCTWRLALLLTRSHRTSACAVILTYAAPLLLATGVVMTADPPFVFLWTLATLLFAMALLECRRWAWVAAGAALGLSLLAKYAAPLWLVGAASMLVLDRRSRPMLTTRWPWIMLLCALPFAMPLVWWNARHGWVSFRHVAEDAGLVAGTSTAANVIDFWLGQAGVAGPLLFLAVCAAVVWAMRAAASTPCAADKPDSRQAGVSVRRALLFLLSTGLPLLVLTLASAFRKHASASWPAPAYISLLILTAWMLTRPAPDTSPAARRRQMFAWAVAAAGFLQGVVAHRPELLYPAVAVLNAHVRSPIIDVRKLDPTLRLRGWTEVARRVDHLLQTMPPDTLLVAADYQTAAALAFHVAGQPRTFCAGAYLSPAHREPFSQYDIWPDRRLDREAAVRNGLAGRDALYIGPMDDNLAAGFSRFERCDDIVVRGGGVEIRRLTVWKCRGFRGLVWPGWQGRYNK